MRVGVLFLRFKSVVCCWSPLSFYGLVEAFSYSVVINLFSTGFAKRVIYKVERKSTQVICVCATIVHLLYLPLLSKSQLMIFGVIQQAIMEVAKPSKSSRSENTTYAEENRVIPLDRYDWHSTFYACFHRSHYLQIIQK